MHAPPRAHRPRRGVQGDHPFGLDTEGRHGSPVRGQGGGGGVRACSDECCDAWGTCACQWLADGAAGHSVSHEERTAHRPRVHHTRFLLQCALTCDCILRGFCCSAQSSINNALPQLTRSCGPPSTAALSTFLNCCKHTLVALKCWLRAHACRMHTHAAAVIKGVADISGLHMHGTCAGACIDTPV